MSVLYWTEVGQRMSYDNGFLVIDDDKQNIRWPISRGRLAVIGLRILWVTLKGVFK